MTGSNLKLGEESRQINIVKYHSYDVNLITTWCQLILLGAISLRAASRILSIILPCFNLKQISIPSWYAGRMWLMRLGYYKLYRAKVKADDWIWIIDHSVQTGMEKCLVVLGVRLCELPQDRSLTYEDVEPIEVLPVAKSNGVVVYEQLEAIVERTGVPRAIVGDYGSDIKSGIEKFCNMHNETDYIYDVKHKIASLLKKILKNNARWELFIKLASQTKQQIQQTALAALAPPAQRSKARYMNTEYLLGWGKNMLLFLSQQDNIITKMDYDSAMVREKLGWLSAFDNDIHYWTDLIELAEITEDFVRKKGIYLNADIGLIELLNKQPHLHSELTLEFKQQIIDFVKNESEKAKPGERILGSSEIIESVFGKQKFIEKEQSKSGFTGLLLALGSIVSKTTNEVVKIAMESTSTKMIREWCQKYIKKSLQAKRTEAFNLLDASSEPGLTNDLTSGIPTDAGRSNITLHSSLSLESSNNIFDKPSMKTNDLLNNMEQYGNQLNAA